jgi:hypothetical protein
MPCQSQRRYNVNNDLTTHSTQVSTIQFDLHKNLQAQSAVSVRKTYGVNIHEPCKQVNPIEN